MKIAEEKRWQSVLPLSHLCNMRHIIAVIVLVAILVQFLYMQADLLDKRFDRWNMEINLGVNGSPYSSFIRSLHVAHVLRVVMSMYVCMCMRL
jgi:hypothetical protein